jgi:hypothetical protein
MPTSILQCNQNWGVLFFWVIFKKRGKIEYIVYVIPTLIIMSNVNFFIHSISIVGLRGANEGINQTSQTPNIVLERI